MKRIVLACAVLGIATGGCSASPSASLPPTPQSRFPQQLKALGTEPFWSLDIDGNRIAYSSADAPAPISAELVRREIAGELSLAGTLSGAALTATVRRESCSDGMSDRTYPYAVDLRWGARTLKGCAAQPG